jgi:chromosome partitioning protein
MLTITLASGKGGSARSTTAIALAVHCHHAGHKTAVLDLDPGQGVLQRWFAVREKPGPLLVTPETRVDRELKALVADSVEYVFIDTEPAIDTDRVVEAGIAFCDLCLIPVRPSFFDVTSIGAVVEMCKDHGRAYAAVLCDVDERKAWQGLATTAAKTLRKQGPLLTHEIHHRVAYVNALTRGLTGGEINEAAREETAALWKEVRALLPERGRHG